jgi:hypothetical protein
MPTKPTLDDVVKDKDFISLAPNDKKQVLDRYFQNVVSKDKSYISLSDLDKKGIADRFQAKTNAILGGGQPTQDFLGEGKATDKRAPYTSERIFNPISEGVAQAGAGLAMGGLPGKAAALGMGAVGMGLEGARQITQAIGSEPGTPRTFSESGSRLAGAYATGAGGEIIGRGIFAGVGKLLGGFKLSPFQQSLRESFEKLHIPYTPADITGSKTMGLLESAASKVPFSGDVIQASKKEQVQALKTAVNNIVDKTGGRISHEQAGDVIIQAVKDASQAHTETKNALYDMAYEMIDQNAPRKSLQSMRKAQELLGEPVYGRIRNMNFSPEANKIISSIAKPESVVPSPYGTGVIKIPYRIGDLLNDSKDLNAFIQSQTAEQKLKGLAYQTTTEGKYLLDLKSSVDRDIDDYFKYSGNKEAKSALDFAKQVYGEGKETFNDPFIKNLVKTSPDKVVDKILNKDNGVALKKIKGIVGEDAFQSVRQKVMQNFAEGAFGTGSEQNANELLFRHSAIKNMISQYSPETLETLFGKDGVKQLEEIVKVSNSMGTAAKIAGNPSGTAQLWGMLNNLSQLLSPATLAKTTAGTTGIPYIYGKLISSKTGRDLILDGLKVTPGTQEAAKLATRFIEFASIEKAKEAHDNKRSK